MKKGIGRWNVIVLLLLVSVGLFFLPRLLTCLNRHVVSPGRASEPLQVDSKVLTDDLVATEDSLSWNVAFTLANISSTAYEDWPDDQTERDKQDFRGWGFKQVSPISHGKQFAYVLSNDDTVVVAFRGTDDWEDVKKDTWFVPKAWHGGHVHGGFLSALNDVEKAGLVSAMRAYGADKKRIWITGHSLGGAMAAIFGYECLVDYKLPPSGVVTFGQPRCFDKTLGDLVGKALRGKYVRFVNEMDIVPWLPPPIPTTLSFRDPYVHVGARFRFLAGKVDFLDTTTIYTAHPDHEKSAVFDGEERISSEKYADIEERIHQAKQSMPRLAMAEGTGIETPIGQLATKSPELLPELNDHLMKNYLSSIKIYSRPRCTR